MDVLSELFIAIICMYVHAIYMFHISYIKVYGVNFHDLRKMALDCPVTFFELTKKCCQVNMKHMLFIMCNIMIP